MSKESPPEPPPEDNSSSAGDYPLSVEVFGEDGQRRAFTWVLSIPDAVEWLSSVPCCRNPREKLMIRIEGGPDHGLDCWMYVPAPGDAPSDWIRSPVARRLRAQIERRKREARR